MTHDERVRHHLYDTCEGILEHAERIASLEELVIQMYTCIEYHNPDGEVMCRWCPYDNDIGTCDFERRTKEMGIEVVE